MQKQNIWTTFWKQGFPTSFSHQLPNSYTGKLAAFWQQQFAKLNSSSVLDIATGNGAIALIAAKTSLDQHNNLKIFASDYAEISPELNSRNKKLQNLYKHIHFFPNTPIENLPFADSEFHLVVSQFGFEYAEPVAATKEISRVLTKSGQFIAICHSEKSHIHNQCLNDWNAYKLAASDLGLDRKLVKVLKVLIEATKPQEARFLAQMPENKNTISALHSGLTKLRMSFPEATPTLYLDGALNYAFNQYLAIPKHEKLNLIESVSGEFQSAFMRIEHQIKSTLSEEKITEIVKLFSLNGLQNEANESFRDQSGETLGRLLIFRKK